MTDPDAIGMVVLILAPFGKDSTLIEGVLRESGIHSRIVGSVDHLIAAITDDAGTAIVAEEALFGHGVTKLARNLESQPPWSDFPLIVLTGGGVSTATTELAVQARAPLGNVTLLERPLRAATLTSAARTALGARRRQLEIRDHLQERKVVEEALRNARDTLESIVEERTAALRRLSAQLLRVQDDERRRIARELHDSLGQYLAAAKINLDTLAFSRNDGGGGLNEAIELIDHALRETRTLSHLLHPPLLDATGLASAITWYLDGFGKRSGIETSLELPRQLDRLAVNVETALFRIMQEALTNVHRHAASPRVEVTLTAEKQSLTLSIRDYGKGIPEQILNEFNQSGTHVGVGLAGIRERVKELGGTFEIRNEEPGTTLRAMVPVSGQRQTFFADTSSQIYSSLAS